MPRKKVSPAATVKVEKVKKLVIDFDNLPEETVSLAELKARNPWSNKRVRKGKGIDNSRSNFNTAINKGRALASALEHQHKITFG